MNKEEVLVNIETAIDFHLFMKEFFRDSAEYYTLEDTYNFYGTVLSTAAVALGTLFINPYFLFGIIVPAYYYSNLSYSLKKIEESFEIEEEIQVAELRSLYSIIDTNGLYTHEEYLLDLNKKRGNLDLSANKSNLLFNEKVRVYKKNFQK